MLLVISSPRVIIIEAKKSSLNASRHCFIVSCSKHIMGPFHQKWLEVWWAPACHSIPSSHQQHSATVDKRNTSKKYFGSPKKSSPPRANFCYLEIKQKKQQLQVTGLLQINSASAFYKRLKVPKCLQKVESVIFNNSSRLLQICCFLHLYICIVEDYIEVILRLNW